MRRPLFTAVVSILAATAPSLHAASIKVQFFPLTGEVRLANSSATPFNFILYTIESQNGALNGTDGVWTSIADTYDVTGNGFIDAANEWVEISPQPKDLTEGSFVPDTFGTLPGLRSVSLGNIWDPDLDPLPHVRVVQADDEFAIVDPDYALDGDYNGDDVVNSADFQFWKAFYGSTSVLYADGNLNGVVDAADYTVWRDNFGKSLVGTVFASAANAGVAARTATVVPEPAAASLVLGLFLTFAICARRSIGWPLY